MNFKGTVSSDLSEKITYSDKWFLEKSTKYNHDMAFTSLVLSLTSFTSGDTILHWGDSGNFAREANLKNAFDTIKFDKQYFYGYDVSLNDVSSKVGYGVASRSFVYDGKTTNVICLVIRSGGYGGEWVDNFRVGSDASKYHAGFYESAQKVKTTVDKYISDNFSDGTNKIWVMGYSRGAATANIVASLYNDTENVYAYTFASPATADIAACDVYNESYDNIFNIINPHDPVIALPPAAWNFGRFGQTFVFPVDTSDKTNFSLLNSVEEYYFKLTGKSDDLFSPSIINVLTDLFTSIAGSREGYYTNFQNIFMEIASGAMTRVYKNNKWVNISFDEYIYNKFGEVAKTAIEESNNNISIKELNQIGISIPPEIEQFNIVARIYGHDNPESYLMKNLTLNTIEKFYAFSKNPDISDFGVGHYPELYISWMKNLDSKQISFMNK